MADDEEIRDREIFTSLFRRVGWSYAFLFGGMTLQSIIQSAVEYGHAHLRAEWAYRLLDTADKASVILLYYPLVLAVAFAPLAQWAWGMRGYPGFGAAFRSQNAYFRILFTFILCVGAMYPLSAASDLAFAWIQRPKYADPATEALGFVYGLSLVAFGGRLLDFLVIPP